MKPFVQGLVCAALCAVVCGCGASQTRIWRSPRHRGIFVSPGTNASGNDSNYAPPTEPPVSEPTPLPEIAPPVRPGDLEPTPAPSVRLETELPPPPAEEEESVQFTIPVPASPMPNVLNPVESKPLLEQSKAEWPANGGPIEVLGEGKIALRMEGHSTFKATRVRQFPVQVNAVEPTETILPDLGAMQVQYVPLLAPVPVN